MKCCALMAIGAALLLLPLNLAFQAHAGGLDALAQPAPANAPRAGRARRPHPRPRMPERIRRKLKQPQPNPSPHD